MNTKFPTSCKCKDGSYPKHALPSAFVGMNGTHYKEFCAYCAAKIIYENGFAPDWIEVFNNKKELQYYYIRSETVYSPSNENELQTFWKSLRYLQNVAPTEEYTYLDLNRQYIRRALNNKTLFNKIMNDRLHALTTRRDTISITAITSFAGRWEEEEYREYNFTLALGTYFSSHYSVTPEMKEEAANYIEHFLWANPRSYWVKL